METKIGGKRVEKLANALGFSGGSFGVDSDGLSGGIGLFWKEGFTVDLKGFSTNHIDVIVQSMGDDDVKSWRFTGFYGEPGRDKRYLSWTLLRRLANALSYPWLCMGDYNETLYGSEHFSNTDRPEGQMRDFRECVEESGLIDLGWSGLPYTWDNRQPDGSNVKARLDRALGNAELLEMFSIQRVQHISMVESDHCAVLVRMQQKDKNLSKPGRRCFKYENVWQSHADYDDTVQWLWQENSGQGGLEGLSNTLRNMQKGLDDWGVKTFGNFKQKLLQLRKQLDRLRLSSMGRGPSKEERELVANINKVLLQEEIWIKQRSRVQWLKAGDKNSSYFHAQAAQRKRINKITTLQREDGSWCDSDQEIHDEVQSFYQQLYSSQGEPNMSPLLQFVQERITGD
jgi:hypothetical protein